MNDKENNPQSQATHIVNNVQSLLEKKEYKKAVEALKEGLQKHPNHIELVKLHSDLRIKYRNEKIQKLQEEAVMFMREGKEDKAQERLREIFRLDPTRIELKDAFNKTKSEKLKDYDRRAIKIDIVNFCYLILFAILIAVCFVCLTVWHNNKKHLDKSEEYTSSGELYNARQELKKCGWFPGGRKQEIYSKLQKEIDKLLKQAHQSMESNDFGTAKECFSIAAYAAENNLEIQAEILKCEQAEQLWKEELARQEEEKEKQRILFEKASAAKQEFEKAIKLSLENNADIEAKDIFEAAKNKAQEAENLFSQNQFESAEKQWLEAAEDCGKASKTAKKIISERNNSLVFKTKCADIRESAGKIDAHAEADNIWREAVKICDDAEQKFLQNSFDAARELWQKAADKFNEAIQITKQSDNYQKSLLFCKKWQLLRPGLSEESIRNFLGSPECVQMDSEKSTWYYQSVPVISENNSGGYEYYNPQYGYICFAASNTQTMVDKCNEAYKRYVGDENRAHKNIIADLNGQIAAEDVKHNSFKSLTEQVYSTRRYGYRNRTRGNVTVTTNSYREYEKEKTRHENQIASLNNAIKKENQRHKEKLEKLDRENQAKVNDLINGLSPREPVYFVSGWKEPDVNAVGCFMSTEEQEKVLIKPGRKWQMPIKWKSLKLNVTEEDVYKTLGAPDNQSTEDGKTIYRYGQLKEYGFLVFEDCIDAVKRLKYWKEPLWPYVTQELQKERRLSESESVTDAVQPDEPNESIVPTI